MSPVDPGQAPREDTPSGNKSYDVIFQITVRVVASDADKAKLYTQLGTKHWEDWDNISELDAREVGA